MREIKFRAWDKNKEIMTDEPFIIGNRKSSDKYFSTLHSPNIYTKQLIWMQYTGLKDKNGKEIYEMDLLDNNTRATTPLIVKWDKSWGRWTLHGHNHKVHRGFVNSIFRVRKLKVIGNIWENRELLK